MGTDCQRKPDVLREHLWFQAKKRRQTHCGVVELVGLGEHIDKVPRMLSSGQRQRMALAKGFLIRTPVFLLDEPTVALDPVSAYEVRKYIREELCQRGATVILTSHYMQEVEELASRVAIMHQGQLIADGSVDALKQQVMDRRLIEITTLDIPVTVVELLRSHSGVANSILHRGTVDSLSSTLRIQLRDGGELDSIISYLANQNVVVTGFGSAEPNLEDVFLQLTGRGLQSEPN